MKAQKILVPIDFSAMSQDALNEADEWACARGARVHLLHVHQIVEVALLDFTYVEPAEKLTAVIEATEKRLGELARGLKTPQDRVSYAVQTGMPVAEIVAASRDFDLIVMPTHGRTGMSHFLMGSVAERVVQGAHCSVLVVKTKT